MGKVKTHMDYTNWNVDPSVVRTWLANSTKIPTFIKRLGIDFPAVLETPLENKSIAIVVQNYYRNGGSYHAW